MAKTSKLLQKARDGRQLTFSELKALTEGLGFQLKKKKSSGSHIHMYIFTGWKGVINIQPDKNGEAKRTQVRQLLKAVDDIGLSGD